MNTPWTRIAEWWRNRRKPRLTVYAMRADEMFVAHPDTDYTHLCSQCGEAVGIYPSTVKLMQEYPVILVCNHCQPRPTTVHPLVPGAESEIRSSRRR